MKKILLTFAVLAGLILVLLGTGYVLSYRIHEVELPAKALLIAPAGGAEVGETVQFVFECRLPRRTSLETVEAELPEQLVLSGAPEIRRSGYFFSRVRYRVAVSAVVLSSGEIPEGTLRLVTDDSALRFTPQTIGTPSFTGAKANAAPQVVLADAMPPQKVSKAPYFWLGGAGLLILLLLWGILRENAGIRAQAKELSMQELAMAEIAELRRALGLRQSPEAVFGRLSNILRIYLERRFGLPLSRSTTEEFFHSPQQRERIPERQRPFLSEFLRTADMVKFAKANAAPEVVREALDHAEKLIQSTSLPEEEGEK